MHLLAFQCTATAPRENLLQYYCSKICNTLLHSFLYGHMFEIIFSLNLSAYLLLWHLTCDVTAQAMPTNPSVSLADAIIMRS